MAPQEVPQLAALVVAGVAAAVPQVILVEEAVAVEVVGTTLHQLMVQEVPQLAALVDMVGTLGQFVVQESQQPVAVEVG